MSQTVVREQEPKTRGGCPDCAGSVHPEGHELVCSDCGLVVDVDDIDHRQEWRDYGNEDEKRRAGQPRDFLKHDYNLGSELGWDYRGFSGKRKQLVRLKRQDSRLAYRSKAERNLGEAFGEIQRMGSALDVERSKRETAAKLCRQSQNEGLWPGRCLEAIAAACIFISDRVQHGPLQLQDVADVSRVGIGRIRTNYDVLNRELGLPIPPPQPADYLGKLVDELGLNGDATRVRAKAEDKLLTWPAAGVGVRPSAAAGAAIYAASQEIHSGNSRVAQEAVAEAAGCSAVTIRTRWREMEGGK